MLKNKTFFPLLIVLIILIFLIFLSFSYNEIFRPAYFSVIGVCQPEKFEGNGYVSAGSTNTTINESGESNTEIWISDNLSPKQMKETLKHEFCHYYQAERNKLYNCDFPILKYFNELECYISQRFPNLVYEKVYDIKIDLES